MRRILSRSVVFPLILLLLLFTLSQMMGCAQLGVPKPEGPAQKIATVLTAVTTVRDSATAALQAGKIDVLDAQYVQYQCDLARQFLNVSKQHLGDEEKMQDKLLLASQIVGSLQAFLASKGAK